MGATQSASGEAGAVEVVGDEPPLLSAALAQRRGVVQSDDPAVLDHIHAFKVMRIQMGMVIASETGRSPNARRLHIANHYQSDLFWRIQESDSDATMPAWQNIESDRPGWAPHAHTGETVFNIGLIDFDKRVQNAGLGRYVVNMVQQALTQYVDGPQGIVLEACYFPSFYTTDSHYGWLQVHYQPYPTAVPRDKYPRFLHARTSEQVEENDKAFLAHYNLEWATPLAWADARIRHAIDFGHDVYLMGGLLESITRDLVVRDLPSFQAPMVRFEYNLVVQVDVSRRKWFVPPSVVRMVIGHDPHHAQHWAMERLSLSLAPVADVLPRLHHHLAEAVTEHCAMLGCGDAVVPALYLWETSFVPAQGHGLADSRLFIKLVLAFLLDHCRVMFRPIVLSHALAERFRALFGDVWPRDPDMMPRPGAAFARIGNGHWLWVPVKRPHSTNYAGTTRLPLPLMETLPVFAVHDTEDERPAKRARTDPGSLKAALPCVACARDMALDPQTLLLSRVVPLCTPACVRAYYQ